MCITAVCFCAVHERCCFATETYYSVRTVMTYQRFRILLKFSVFPHLISDCDGVKTRRFRLSVHQKINDNLWCNQWNTSKNRKTTYLFLVTYFMFICFLYQVLIPCCYSSFSCASSCWGDLFLKDPKAPSIRIRSGWNFAGLFLEYFMCRLTESDSGYDVILSRWRPWRYFLEMPRATSLVTVFAIPVRYSQGPL